MQGIVMIRTVARKSCAKRQINLIIHNPCFYLFFTRAEKSHLADHKIEWNEKFVQYKWQSRSFDTK